MNKNSSLLSKQFTFAIHLIFLVVLNVFSVTSAQARFVNWETPQVHPMDMTPDGTKLLSVNTANNSLEVFNVTATGINLAQSIPVGLDPVTVRARTNNEVWVVNQISDSVSIVDLTKGAVIATLDTDDEPADVVFAGSPVRAFVSCSQSNSVMVFNPDNISSAPETISINGEDPRALAVSPNGLKVYAAIFESGNGSTILAGGRGSGDPGNVVDSPLGPYGGINPPPNSGNAFSPPINPAAGTPPKVGLIVRKDNNNRWMDDNNRDWSLFISGNNAPESGRVVGWDLPDRDIAIINTSTLAVSYKHRVMTTLMAMDINPANGQILVVGTEAENQIRYEPNLRNTFLKVNMARSSDLGGTIIKDLNPHLTYTHTSAPQNVRNQSIGDPRGVKWNSNGTLIYVTGMGSNNVAIMNVAGDRVATINVGEGPTGIALHESSNRAFVLNRFAGSISIIDLNNNVETAKVAIFDPTPSAIKVGRKHLYNTHLTSGLGQLSCASCHVDARHDRLSWDLGNPQDPITTINNIQFPPMKGPMRTQTLLDVVGSVNLHFRGDRTDIPSFAGTFTNLQGTDQVPSQAALKELEAYLATVHIPPNPYRNLDNSMPTSIAIPGPGNRVGNPHMETTANTAFNGCSGSGCHSVNNKGRGITIRQQTGNRAGPQPSASPTLRNMHELFGLYYNDATASNAGFAFIHDGSFDPNTQATLKNDNNLAFMLAYNGDFPQDTHAAVGKQVTISGSPNSSQTLRLNALIALVDTGVIGLVAKGSYGGASRGFYYQGQRTNRFQSDKFSQTVSLANLLQAALSEPMTFTAVAAGTEQRIGVDENEDGVFNNDSSSSFVAAAWSFEQHNLTGSAGEILDTNTSFDSSFNGTAFGGLDTTNSNPAINGSMGTCHYINFDGVDDYISLGNPDQLNITGQITLSAWIRPDRQTTSIENIFSHTHSVNPRRAVFLRTWNGNYQFGSWDGSDHLAAFRMPISDIGTGTWVHLAGVYDGEAFILYRNGVEVARENDPNGALSVDQDWTIGAFGQGNKQFFKGGIDEVHIEGRGLSPDAIRALASKTHPCTDAPVTTTTATTSNSAATIVVDGNVSDWGALSFFPNDPDDIATGSNNVIDFESASFAHNEEDAYIVIRNRNAVDPDQNSGTSIPWGWQVYIDSDNNADTGFEFSDVVGADYLIEGNVIQRYNGTGTEWSWLTMGSSNPTFDDKTIEMSFKRQLIGNPGNINVVFQGDNEPFGGTTIDLYPDGAKDSQSANRFLSYSFGAASPHLNLPPSAFNQGISVASNRSISFDLTVSDQENDPISIELLSMPSNGSIQVNGIEVLYTPTNNFIGSDSFTYRASDTVSSGNTVTVNINVLEDNTTNAPSNNAFDLTMKTDGTASDWSGFRLFNTDPNDIANTNNNSINWLQAGLAHSNENVYMMYSNRINIDPSSNTGTSLNWGWQTYVDTDNDATTGYQLDGRIGADILIEGQTIFRFGGGSGWDWIKIGTALVSYKGTIAELSFPRRLLGPHGLVKVVFMGNNAAYGGTALDSYPNNGSFEYFFGSGSFDTNTTNGANSQSGLARSPAAHEPLVSQLTDTVTSATSTTSNSGGGSFSWVFLLSLAILMLGRHRRLLL